MIVVNSLLHAIGYDVKTVIWRRSINIKFLWTGMRQASTEKNIRHQSIATAECCTDKIVNKAYAYVSSDKNLIDRYTFTKQTTYFILNFAIYNSYLFVVTW